MDVIEIAVKPGDKVEKEQTLLVLESDKATVEVPSPFSGVVKELVVSVGQAVKQGDKVAVMDVGGADVAEAPEASAPAAAPTDKCAKTGNATGCTGGRNQRQHHRRSSPYRFPISVAPKVLKSSRSRSNPATR
ncbi:MAG: biotin/lipoyl-containing protein [Gammaproteobacteria bacterium]